MHHKLDARGLFCPMPVIRAQDRVEELEDGDTLEVIASDPGALNDIPAWCRINGHKLLESENRGDEVRLVIQVVADGARPE